MEQGCGRVRPPAPLGLPWVHQCWGLRAPGLTCGPDPSTPTLSAGRGPLPRSLAGAPWDRRANPSLSGWGSAWPCRMWGTQGRGLWLHPGIPLLGVNVSGSRHAVLNVGAHWPGPALPCGQPHPASEPTLGSPGRPAGPGPRVHRDPGTPGPPSSPLPWSLAPGPHPPPRRLKLDTFWLVLGLHPSCSPCLFLREQFCSHFSLLISLAVSCPRPPSGAPQMCRVCSPL